MRLTRRELQKLVENYLNEQDALGDVEEPEGEETDAAETAEPPEEETAEPPEEETAEPPAEDSETAEPAEPEEPEFSVEEAEPFDIVDSKGVKTKIEFFEDEVGGEKKIFVKANGERLKNADKATMLGLAGVGVMGVKDEVTRKVLAKIAQAMDANLQKYGDDVEKVGQDIKRKSQGSRFPFDNFEKLISKAKG